MEQIKTYQNGEYEIVVSRRKLRNPRNLKRANYHMRARAYNLDDETVAQHPYAYRLFYKSTEPVWNRLRKRTCIHFDCECVADIPYEKIEGANEYCITLIDR